MAVGTRILITSGEQKFIAKPTGKDEVPPKNTKATGTAEFNATADGKNNDL